MTSPPVLATPTFSWRKPNQPLNNIAYRNCCNLKRLLSILLLLSLCLVVRAQDECDDAEQECTDQTPIKRPTISKIDGITFTQLAEGGVSVDYKGGDKIHLFRCGCGKGVSDDNDAFRVIVKPKRVFVENRDLLGLYGVIWEKGEHISATTNQNEVFKEDIRDHFMSGEVTSINRDDEGQPNFSSLKGKVDVSIISRGSLEAYKKAAAEDEEGGLPPFFLIPFDDAIDPIERLEYVKLIGMLFERVDGAVKHFDETEKKYNEVKEIAENKAFGRPSVFFNYPTLKDSQYQKERSFDGNFEWEQPAPKSVLTTLVEHARAAYRLGEGNKKDGRTLSYDEILDNFESAKFLLNAGNPEKITSARNMTGFVNEKVDERVPDDADNSFGERIAKRITASWCKNVYSEQRQSNKDISDFYEGGVARPDLILTDFVKILHPEIESLEKRKMTYLYQYEFSNRDVVGSRECEHNPLRVPKKEQNKEYVFVDLQYIARDSDFKTRFEIEDEDFEGQITRGIRDNLKDFANIDDIDLELVFPANDRGISENLFIIRAQLPKSEVDNFRGQSDIVTDALQDRLFLLNVSPTAVPSPTPSNTPSPSPKPSSTPPRSSVPEESGGIGGGAIAGIVIAVIVILAILLFFLAKRRGRSNQQGPVPDASGGGWDGEGTGLEGTETGPTPSTGLFAGRRNRQRIQSTSQNDDPFEI